MFKVLLIFTTAIALAACNKQNIEQGGQDSGGGDIAGAIPEQVEALFSERKSLEIDLKTILRNFKEIKISRKQDQKFLRNWAARFEKLKANLSKIIHNIDLNDTCKDLHNNEKSASVSDYSMNGKICLSKSDLSKNLPEVLKKQTHAIIFHEISHLMGLKEKSAQRIQALTLKYYDKLTKSGPSYLMHNQLIDSSEKTRKNITLLLKKLAADDHSFGQYVGGGRFEKEDKGTITKIKEIDSDLKLVASAAEVLADQMIAKFKNKDSILFDNLKLLTALPDETRFQVEQLMASGYRKKTMQKLSDLYGKHYQFLLETENQLRSF